MKKFGFVLLLLTLSVEAFTQKTYLTVRLKENAPVSAYLYLNRGSKLIPVDSILLGRGIFTFNTTKLKPGIYSFVLSEDMFARFIINNESVEATSSLESLADSVRIISSEENRVYYSFLRARESYNKKQASIETLLELYPQKAKVAKVLRKEKGKLESEYNSTVRDLINTKGNLLASQVIMSELSVKAPESLSPEQQKQYLIANWWSSFPFENPNITNTPSIADRLWDYFDLFYVDGASRAEQDEYFKRAVDEVMNQPSISKEVQDFFVEEMVKTLSQSSHDELIRHIKVRYANNVPRNLDEEFDRILKTSIGQIAPNFSIATDSLKTELYKLKSSGYALVFWSMECSHCRKLLPELVKHYKKLKEQGFEIVAINLDAYRPAWKLDVKTNGYQWININVQNPYSDPITRSYNIEGTPTILILDSQRRIVEKPSDTRGILKAFEKLVSANKKGNGQ